MTVETSNPSVTFDMALKSLSPSDRDILFRCLTIGRDAMNANSDEQAVINPVRNALVTIPN